MNDVNERPGACVCVVRWDGEIVYYNPNKYNPIRQGDTPTWLDMQQKHERREENGKNRNRAVAPGGKDHRSNGIDSGGNAGCTGVRVK